MKILFAITKSNLGGAQRYVLELAGAAAERGHEVAVAVGGAGPLVEHLRAKGIEVFIIKELGRDVSPLKDFASFQALRHIVAQFQPDILQLNSSKIGVIGSIAGRLTRYPNPTTTGARRPKVLFTAHGWAFNEDRSTLSRVVIKLLHYATILFSDATIAVSASMIQPFKHWPFAAKKMRVVHNGVPAFNVLSRDDARTAFNADGFNLSSSPFVVGMLSELHPIKRIDVAIRAIAQIPDATLVVCGEGSERSKLELLARELGVTDRIILAGFVADARTRLRAFDCFLMSSDSEAFAYAALEAGYAGVPTIVTEVGGLPEAVSPERGFIVPRRDPDAVARAIESIKQNPTAAAERAALQKEYVTKEFSIETMIEKTLAQFQ